MDGLELAIRFSYVTNTLHYCGPKDAENIFIRYLEKKDNADAVRKALIRFEGLFPYFSTIAKRNKKELLDKDVVEAYWIGNTLLDSMTRKDNQVIIEKLMKRGLPKSIGGRLIKELPEGFVPHHCFNVFYVGVGHTTGSVETTLANMNNCRPAWGTVVEVMPNAAIVDSQSIIMKKGKYVIGPDEAKTAVYLEKMLPKVKKGDVVGLHWGMACTVLNKTQAANLKKHTEKTLTVLNHDNPPRKQ
jgi:hydrogenase maturation factor